MSVDFNQVEIVGAQPGIWEICLKFVRFINFSAVPNGATDRNDTAQITFITDPLLQNYKKLLKISLLLLFSVHK